MARCDRRTALRALAAGAAAAWVDSLSALAAQHAHSPAAQAAMAAQEWTPRVLNPQQNETIINMTEKVKNMNHNSMKKTFKRCTNFSKQNEKSH